MLTQNCVNYYIFPEHHINTLNEYVKKNEFTKAWNQLIECYKILADLHTDKFDICHRDLKIGDIEKITKSDRSEFRYVLWCQIKDFKEWCDWSHVIVKGLDY